VTCGAIDLRLIKELMPTITSDTQPFLPRAEHNPLNLPEKPLVTIEPQAWWIGVNLRDLWSYRELLYFLTWRDIKVRYKQTLLGAAWAILQPVFMMLIFTIFFGRLAGVNTGRVPYSLFAFAGLVPWTFFANSVTASGNSLVGSANLITKVYFPRLLVPAGAVAAGFVDFMLASIVLAGLLFFYNVTPTWHILMLPPLIVLTVLFALSVGMWLSALNVKYRDVRFALPFMIQLWLFVSSVILPSSVVPQRFRWLLMLNPMSAIIEGFRSTLLGLPFDGAALLIAAVITLLALVGSAYSFKRMEKHFADII
jgi:lipopolysaccharide transport system permease protein